MVVWHNERARAGARMPTSFRNTCSPYLCGAAAVVLWALTCAGWPAIGGAQEAQHAEGTPSASAVALVKPVEAITAEMVQRQLDQAKTAKDVDDATKAKVGEVFQQALARLDPA